MTGWISNEGRLTRAPQLRHRDDGTAYCFAHVVVTDRVKGADGEWTDGPRTFYSLTVVGHQAVELCETAKRCGNIMVAFCGPFRVETYRSAGGPERSSVNVFRARVSVPFGGYTVTVERKDGAPIGTRPATAGAGQGWAHDVERPGPDADLEERFGPADDPWAVPATDPAAAVDEGLFEPPARAGTVGLM